MKKMRSRTGWIAVIFCLALIAGAGSVTAATMTYNSTDVPKSITTNIPPATSAVTVPCGGNIVDVNVQLDISHPYVSDLVITLIAPDGTSILLANRRGADGANYSGTVFDDEAATAISAGTRRSPGHINRKYRLPVSTAEARKEPGPCRLGTCLPRWMTVPLIPGA
ncbi:MAG: proprotein convertase P-domain-containing protein [Desulfobulbaceae bacterium]|jgi:hypothetical protein|nr:proprotein convertase P-domain-containing protein [Desulfobulbaceae bacterium]